MLSRVIPPFITVLLLASTLSAQQGSPDSVDEFVRAQMRAQNIPGLALAVIRDGRVSKAAGYGLANRKTQQPVTPETVFKIASVSKQFIATGIMLLVQDGRLRIDDPIAKYLDGAPVAWNAITVRHALTHTGGLVREAPGYDWEKPQPDATVIRSAYSRPLLFQPGAKWEYSNVGYFILGEIISRVSGKPWPDFINERVFVPTGMTATYPTNTKGTIAQRAAGYTDNEKLDEAPEWMALRPSGAFLSTVLDLAKWDAMLYTDRILADSTKQLMWTSVRLTDGRDHGYGFGWQLGAFRNRRMVHHGGGGPGIASEFARFVDERLSIILLINLDDVDSETLLYGIAGLYLAGAEHW